MIWKEINSKKAVRRTAEHWAGRRSRAVERRTEPTLLRLFDQALRVCSGCLPSANSSTIFAQNAGRSSGLRLVTSP